MRSGNHPVIAIVEVETILIDWLDFDALLNDLRWLDEIERSRKMHHFLKYERFCLSIW